MTDGENMLERVAAIIDPPAFQDRPYHNQGECPYCDDSREAARRIARAVMDEIGLAIKNDHLSNKGNKE